MYSPNTTSANSHSNNNRKSVHLSSNNNNNGGVNLQSYSSPTTHSNLNSPSLNKNRFVPVISGANSNNGHLSSSSVSSGGGYGGGGGAGTSPSSFLTSNANKLANSSLVNGFGTSSSISNGSNHHSSNASAFNSASGPLTTKGKWMFYFFF
jgi:hypothetical protein